MRDYHIFLDTEVSRGKALSTSSSYFENFELPRKYSVSLLTITEFWNIFSGRFIKIMNSL